MKQFYFAYGSNMLQSRLRERVGSAQSLGRARLPGYRLEFRKRGRDGSAKCDAVASWNATDVLPGVLYQLEAGEREALDRAEGLGKGYELASARVLGSRRRAVEAFFYVATDISHELLPWDWYRDLVVAGALEHGLGAAWIARLRSQQCWRDSSFPRLRRHRRLLC